jgi:CHAD domain-containing protein
MEPSHLSPSNFATLPPPGAALAAILESPDPLLPHPHPPQRTRNVPGWLAEPAAIKLAFPAKPQAAAAGPFLAAALNRRWQSYRERLRQCQEDFSEEAVHELRVATRRLLAQFILLSCVAPSVALEKVRRTFKRRLSALGNLRDTHVQRLFIEQQAARFPELLLLCAWLERRERRLVKSAAGKVSRFKTGRVEKCITAMDYDLTANGGRARAQSQLATAVLRAAAEAFAEAVERRQAIDPADLRTIHQTRVAFKRFRYMMESLSPGVTGLSKRQLRALAYYQRKMGIIQDLQVIQACVARYTRKDRTREALLYRFSRYLERRRARALRSFLKFADHLFEFWPPAALSVRGDPVPTRTAA